MRCGTPGFVAPEVINIKDMKTRYDAICDMFSLGTIFHLLLVGEPLFKSQKNDALVKENRTCDYDLSSVTYEKLPHEAMDLMKKMLRVDPLERINA